MVELTEAEAATIEGRASYAICSGCHGCGAVASMQ
jgi:hypothetical protein